MKLEITLALIAAVTSIINTIGLVYIARLTLKTEKNTNSMKDELVSLTGAASLAKGKLEGRAELVAEQKEHRS